MIATTNKLSRAEKRVQIVKDVLKWHRAKRIKAESLTYLHLADSLGESDEAQLRDVLKAQVYPCSVCMVGGLMYAHIMRNNHLTIGEWRADDTFQDMAARHLHEAFSARELRRLEDVFERNPCISKAGEKFYTDYPNRDERLVAMLKNMAKNGGVFVLPTAKE